VKQRNFRTADESLNRMEKVRMREGGRGYLHPSPSTLHPQTSNLHPPPCTLHPPPSTLKTVKDGGREFEQERMEKVRMREGGRGDQEDADHERSHRRAGFFALKSCWVDFP